MHFTVTLLIFSLFQIEGVISDARVRFLPGVENFEKLKYKQYSGFLRATKAHFLHYWFLESQNDPKNDPLIIWYSGGPGCSSMYGALSEHGPLLLGEDGLTLNPNEYTWAKKASVLYIESPVGVGYSFSADGIAEYDDNKVADENYAAVKDFFVQYPKYRNHSVFIAAESYGGVYVPMLAGRIIDGQHKFPINFKGVMLGNGLLSESLRIKTFWQYTYTHGLLDEAQWFDVLKKCCNGCIKKCNFEDKSNKICQQLVNGSPILPSDIYPYDLHQRCIKLTAYDFNTFVPCANLSGIMLYLNELRVRRALNVPDNVQHWTLCNITIRLSYKRTEMDMSVYMKKLLKNKIRILLYYGDTDSVCPFMLAQKFVEELGIQRLEKKKPWYFGTGRRLGGMQTIYKDLTFLTILGAGHMAPQTHSPLMQYVIYQFLANESIGV